MNKKTQQGIALLWVIFAGTLLITSVGAIASKKKAPRIKESRLEASPIPSPSPMPEPVSEQEDFSQQEPLLKILPPKERAELESAIRETQQVLKNIEVFNYTPPSIEDITKGLDQINKQTTEQIQKNIEKQQQDFQQKYQQEIDIDKMMERLNQNPPAVPHEGEKKPSLEEQEYYYRKYILKDPAVQY